MERVTDDMIDEVQAGLATSESEGQQRMRALHGSGDRRDLEIHPNLWAGVGLVRGGAGTALVGSHAEVANLHRGVRQPGHHGVHPLRLPAPGRGILVRRGRPAGTPSGGAAGGTRPRPAKPGRPTSPVQARSPTPGRAPR